MRERAGLHGGTVEWSGRRRNGGTTVTVHLARGGRLCAAKNAMFTRCRRGWHIIPSG
jgi:hypothetical protein